MITIGIDCEPIETDSWGVARIIYKILEEIDRRPGLAREFKFFLFFKSKIPNLPFLDNPIFEKKIIHVPLMHRIWNPASYSLYYYVFLPITLWFKGLNMMFWPNYMLPIIATGKNLVMLTDDIYYEMRQGQISFRYKLAYQIFSRWATIRATKLLAISEASKQELIRLFHIDPKRIVVNPLGIDIREKTIHTADHKEYILYVGQAFPRRHLRETLLAFEKIALEFPQLNFIAVGADRYSPPVIEQLVREINHRLGKDRITYHSYINDAELAQLYTDAKLVAYISSREAFGLPPLEALAYGTVPVVAEAAVTREMFGEYAFFVPEPDSIDSIVQTLRTALTDTAQRFRITGGAESIVKKYTWSAHTDRFLQIARSFIY